MSKTNLKPLGSHVLVLRATPAEISQGGIVLPEKAKDKPKEGKILAVGNGKMLEDGKRQKMQVKAGDRVLFSSYAGTEVKAGGEEYLVMEETDIFAVIE
jgi:chaperonin GroES